MAKLHFMEEKQMIDIHVGENILEAALENGFDLDHACGGVCACSTCHVKIRTGADSFNESTDDEEDQLDDARDVNLDSRLACQATLESETDEVIELEVPFWNVNLVQEGPDAAREQAAH